MRSDLRRNAWEVCGHPTVARLFEPSRLHWSLQVLGPRVQNAEGCLRRLQRKRVQDPVVQELVERSSSVRQLRELRSNQRERWSHNGRWDRDARSDHMSRSIVERLKSVVNRIRPRAKVMTIGVCI